MKKIFYSFVLLFALAKPCSAQVIEQDSLAVYDIFNATYGSTPNGPVTTWPNIVVTGDRVTALTLNLYTFGPNIAILPASIGNLTALKKLYINGGGSMTGMGSFPASFTNLTALEDFGVSSMTMGFTENSAIFSMPWIKRLSANGCWGMYIPSAISRMTGLEYLSVAYNIGGASISPDVCNCPNLEYIDVSNNLYPVGIFPGIGRLTKLKYYNSSGGDYDINGTIPDSIGYCTELRVLNLSGVTTLEGEIPASITNCHKLSTFWVNGEWYGVNPFFDNIAAFPDLDTLVLNTSINQTPNQIPDAFSSLTHLTYLSLSGYGISGTIPSALGNCPALKTLSLSSQYFTGSIPASLGNISTLKSLSIYGPNITGGIPANLGNLSQLQSLSISGTLIGGTIPASLNNLTQLQSLSLSNCSLSGPVPSLSNLPASASINLSSNKFTFDGMEAVEQHFTSTFISSPQVNISIRYNNIRLSVSAGGTVANNTYKWYRAGALYRIVTGDSTLVTSQAGSYYVEVTNSNIQLLTLTSNSMYVPIKLCPPAASTSLTSNAAASYQWQMNDGSGYVSISDNANFSGTTSQILQLINIPSSWTGYQFRCSYSAFRIQFQLSWTGAVSNDWNYYGNWGNCGSVPDSNTDVVISAGNVVLNTNTTIRSLSIAPGASITVSPGVTLTVLH